MSNRSLQLAPRLAAHSATQSRVRKSQKARPLYSR
jgi:hypothetical protein